ncbi:MAG: hypothetical protein ABJB74_20085 [Gemmatimonas sp.]
MNRISRMVGIVACATLPAVAQAQTSTPARPVSFGVMAGASVPVGDFGDGNDVGFTVGAHLLLAPTSMPALAFRGDVTFDRWKYNGIGSSVVDGNTSTIGVMGNVILRSSSAMAIKPYVIGGVGLLSSKGSSSVTIGGVTGSTESDRSNNLGVQAGGGLEFQLSGFTTFIEAKFVNAFTKDANDDRHSANWIPITFGIRF